MIQNKSEILNRNPQLIEDITLFKLVLMPLELYTLKYLLLNLRPTTIRELYTTSISICFHRLFFPEELNNPQFSYRYIQEDLLKSGYCLGIVDDKIKAIVKKKYVTEMHGKSETEKLRNWIKPLKEANSKYPSYEKFKSIFENFERLGIIYKRGKEGKGIAYGLNPHFYEAFKGKRKEIINL